MKKQLEDVRDVEIANSEFYIALNALFRGEVDPMLAVWSHNGDVSYLGPEGGILLGWKNVKAAWEKGAALKLGGKIEAKQAHIFRCGEIGIVQCDEVGMNRFHGKDEKVNIRATNIFRKEDGKWKMTSHHTDLFSFLKS